MSDRKRKISIRKVLQTLLTIIVVTGFTMAVVSADRLQNSKKVNSVTVQIRNGNVVHFLDNAEVMKMLFADRHLDPHNMKLASLDIHKMEHIVRSNPWVSDAQVYIDNERNMHVFVTQRVPVVRIFEENNNSYYLDTALKAVPLSEQYVHYTPLVTGAPALSDDSNSRVLKGEVLSIVNYLNNHKFWNAQIAQIVMAPGHTFELIPVLGKQRILIGDTSMLDTKLNNLLAFYTQVQNKVGWEKYEVIDLRYDGQIIASPALKWKIPYDKALSDMAWVKAVMESAPKGQKDEAAIGLDSVAASAQTVAAVAPKKPVPVTPQAVAAPLKPKQTPKPGQHLAVVKPVGKHDLKPAAHAPKPLKKEDKNKKKPIPARAPKKPDAAHKKPIVREVPKHN